MGTYFHEILHVGWVYILKTIEMRGKNVCNLSDCSNSNQFNGVLDATATAEKEVDWLLTLFLV